MNMQGISSTNAEEIDDNDKRRPVDSILARLPSDSSAMGQGLDNDAMDVASGSPTETILCDVEGEFNLHRLKQKTEGLISYAGGGS